MKNVLVIVGLIVATTVGLVGGRFAASLLAKVDSGFTIGDYSVQLADSGHRVVLLGTKWCGFCEKTRKHLASLGVEYADLDIEDSVAAAEMHRKLGAKGVPVLLVGDRQIRGFRPRVIDAALQAMND